MGIVLHFWGFIFHFLVHFISTVEVFLRSSVTSVHHKLFHWQQVCYVTLVAHWRILLQVEKPAQSLCCDYCFIICVIWELFWRLLFDLYLKMPWFSFHSISARYFPALVDLCVIFASFFSLLVWVLEFFVGLILCRVFHLIWFEPSSQQYLTLAKVVHRHTYEEII